MQKSKIIIVDVTQNDFELAKKNSLLKTHQKKIIITHDAQGCPRARSSVQKSKAMTNGNPYERTRYLDTFTLFLIVDLGAELSYAVFPDTRTTALAPLLPHSRMLGGWRLQFGRPRLSSAPPPSSIS
jgi:hypothetical protein